MYRIKSLGLDKSLLNVIVTHFGHFTVERFYKRREGLISQIGSFR